MIPGDEPGAIVLGAHFDTKNDIPGFVGANDGASGVAVVLELARALRRAASTARRSTLALFDAEEARGERPFQVDGARGSRQYVRIARAGGAPGVPPIDRIGSMVLLDMVGDCDLAIPREAELGRRALRVDSRRGRAVRRRERARARRPHRRSSTPASRRST